MSEWDGGSDDTGYGDTYAGDAGETAGCGATCPVKGCGSHCVVSAGHGGYHICAAQMHQWTGDGGAWGDDDSASYS